ncbi:hypothetical protein DFJ74DRAFT_680018 [Hyaloraphidium curvatum]|nr:hypothetical protein DFJ74DRAFT_680018 [Hyaloraphidium curvatum]
MHVSACSALVVVQRGLAAALADADEARGLVAGAQKHVEHDEARVVQRDVEVEVVLGAADEAGGAGGSEGALVEDDVEGRLHGAGRAGEEEGWQEAHGVGRRRSLRSF